jgi:hypothetical protein
LGRRKNRDRSRKRQAAVDDFHLGEEVRYIQGRAAAHDGRFVMVGQLVLFSTNTGDAWLLDPAEHLAVRLARGGYPEEIYFAENESNFAIGWTGRYRVAFRVPTYTDLYYHDPANLGNPDLLPERAWSYEGGLDLFPSPDIRAEITVFHRREENGIDYVRRSPTDVWRATNIHRLRFTGVEAALATRWGLRLSYTGLHGAQRALESVESRYVFNYPSHSAVAGWLKSARGWVARARIGALVRRGRSPYAVVDLYGARAAGRLRPFLQLTNLAGTRYEEIPGVAMPGRAVVGGVEISIFGR